MPGAKTLLEKLEDKILLDDGCWEWAGGHSHGTTSNGGGYARISIGRSAKYAHRVVYELLVGPIPAGMDLDHLCRNRGCVRPDHLEPVTRQENLLRGHDARTHCPNGHLLDEANIYRHKNHGRRRCRACVLA